LAAKATDHCGAVNVLPDDAGFRLLGIFDEVSAGHEDRPSQQCFSAGSRSATTFTLLWSPS
jgi:hypothetical protein